MSVPSGFYAKVMALPIARPSVKPAKKKKAGVKKKGKKPKVQKVKGGKTEPLDVFKVALEADAGAGSSKQDAFFQEHLSELSESQLERLKAKIEKVRKRYLEGSPEHRQISRANAFIKDAVDHRLERSQQLLLDLKASLLQKLETLQDTKLVANHENRERIAYQGKEYPLRRFARQYCGGIIDKYNSLIRQQKIIPRRLGETGTGFVTRQIRNYLNGK